MSFFEVFVVINLFAIFPIIGGILSYLKKDYFSRGFCLSLLTGLYGVISIALSPKSHAKEGDEYDEHNWPPYALYAILAIIVSIIIIWIVG